MTYEHQAQIQKVNRVMAVVAVACSVSLLVLTIVLVVRLLPDKYETALGDYPAPSVLNRVDGIPGPSAHLGEVLVLKGDRCVNRNTKTETTTVWVYAGPPPVPSPSSIYNSEVVRGPTSKGCMTATYNLQMPARVIVGLWTVRGIVSDVPSGDVRYWQSEEFLIVQ